MVGYTPQVRVDIFLEDGDVDVVLQMLRITDAHYGLWVGGARYLLGYAGGAARVAVTTVNKANE